MPRSTRSRCRRRWESRIAAALLVATQAPAHAATPAHCTDVQLGSAPSYDCLNATLKNDVQDAKPAPDAAVLGATSPAPRIGLYNQAGTREHLGANFGISAYPARPH